MFGVLAVALSSFASAGETLREPTLVAPEPEATHDWCDALKSIGKLYKDPENPLVQSFTVFGRFQYQAGVTDGNDVNGDDFTERIDEYRRVRVGAKAQVLGVFDILARINLEDDDRPTGGGLDWGFQDFDEFLIGIDLKKAFQIDQLDSLSLVYGRHKFAIGLEANQSSKEILTPERSAISNKIFGTFRPTGFKLHAAKGPWTALLGIYSTEEEDIFLAGFGESLAYQVSLGRQVNDNLNVVADFVFNDSDENDGSSNWEYHWAASLSGTYTNGRFGLFTDLILGDNGDEDQGNVARARQGAFWGAVIIPHYWLVQDRFELVASYQYQASSQDEGIELNSRNVVRSGQRNPAVDVNGGRGDLHQSVYGGCNYYLCGTNAKVFAGVEYDNLDTPAGNVEAVTFWLGFRSHF